MTELTLKIPDKKLDFFLGLIKELGFEFSQEQEMAIPEQHKAIVRERMRQSELHPERMLDWEEIQDNFKFD